MAGIVIKRFSTKPREIDNVRAVGSYYYLIECKECQFIEIAEQTFLLIDGYYWPQDQAYLIDVIQSKNFAALNEFEGHFSGILIQGNDITIFNDRFGGKTIFYSFSNEELILASRPNLMPVNDITLSPSAAHECFYFRWTSNEKTLLADTKKLRARSFAKLQSNISFKQECYWLLSTAKYNNSPLAEKQLQVKKALIANLKQAQKRYKKVAIFLSGGVDSSLLAALSKDVFEHCFLVTPVFKGQINPELNTAKAFAAQLGLPHHLVEVSPETLETELNMLVSLKREPLRHYSSLAMLAMLKAIPEEFDAVVYGEAADTLFGSNGINRIKTQFKWKQSTKVIPLFLLQLLKKLVPGRGKVLVDLKRTSLTELIYSLTAIQYSPKSTAVISKLDPGKGEVLETQTWQKKIEANMTENVRYVAQEYIISSDIGKHFEEAEIIASYFNKHIISPFFDPKVIELANTLTDDDYFGDGFVKPVLREIACEYFSRELIYQRKYGFPVPFIAWLNGPLAHLVDNVRNERILFDGQLLDGLSIEKDYETFWLLINWQIFRHQVMQESLSEL